MHRLLQSSGAVAPGKVTVLPVSTDQNPSYSVGPCGTDKAMWGDGACATVHTMSHSFYVTVQLRDRLTCAGLRCQKQCMHLPLQCSGREN